MAQYTVSVYPTFWEPFWKHGAATMWLRALAKQGPELLQHRSLPSSDESLIISPLEDSVALDDGPVGPAKAANDACGARLRASNSIVMDSRPPSENCTLTGKEVPGIELMPSVDKPISTQTSGASMRPGLPCLGSGLGNNHARDGPKMDVKMLPRAPCALSVSKTGVLACCEAMSGASLQDLPLLTWSSIPLITGAHKVLHKLSVFSCSTSASFLPKSILLLALTSIWFVAVASVQSQSAAWLTVNLPLAAVTMLQIASIDAVLKHVLLRQFEACYLLTQSFALITLWTWSLRESVEITYHFVFGPSLFLVILTLLTSDARVGTRPLFTTGMYVLVLFFFLEVLIRDLAGDNMRLEAYQICVFLCSDTRRMLLVVLVSMLMFFLKHLALRARSWPSTVFAMILLPLTFSRELHEVDKAYADTGTFSVDAESSFQQRADSVSEQMPVSHSHRRAMFVRITAQVSDVFSQKMFDGLPGVSVTSSCDGLTLLLPFQPVVPFPWVRQLSRRPLYRVGILAVLAFVVAVNTFEDLVNNPFISYMVAIVVAFIWFVEMSHFDRSLIKAVMSRFEWMLLLLNTVQLLLFGVWAQHPQFVMQANLPYFLLFMLVVAFGFGLMDAAPAYPRSTRLLGALLIFANTWRATVVNYFNPYYQRYPVCFYFCTDTAVLALSANFTIGIFFAKYVICLIRYPNRGIIARMHLKTVVQKTDPTPGSGSVKTCCRPSEMSPPVLGEGLSRTESVPVRSPSVMPLVQARQGVDVKQTDSRACQWSRFETDEGIPYFYDSASGTASWVPPDADATPHL